MDEVLHDPRTKQQLKDAIYNHLYEPVKRSYNHKLQQIIRDNSRILRSPHESFTYRGQIYAIDAKATMPRKMNRLVPSLQPQMEAYLAEVKRLNDNEVPFVMGFVNQVLNASNTFEDYLRLLPESIHGSIRAMQASCPCRTVELTEEDIQAIREKNQHSIDLMKQRQVLNLLL